MKTFRFDFDLDIWVQCLEVEEDDYEGAKAQLLSMSVKDIIKNGYVKDFEIKQIDYEEVEEG